MLRRTEQALNSANIAACFATVATAAEVTLTGGASALIGASLSGLSMFKGMAPEQKARTEDIATALDAGIGALPNSDTQKLVRQLIANFPVSEADLATGNRDATQVAGLLRGRAKEKARDPEQRQDHVLAAFEDVLRRALEAPLEPQSGREAFEKATLERTDRLIAIAEEQGRADALRDEGITEKAIIRLAQRIAAETEDVGQAWLELQNAMDIAVRVQKEGERGSNHPGFVDDVLARVAALARDGEYQTAGAEIDAALERAQAEQARLLDSGVEVALLDRDTAKAARLLVQKADLEADGVAEFEDLRAMWRHHYEIGRDRGDNLQARLATDLARIVSARAKGPDEIGSAANDLGLALQILGERDSDTALLEQAVRAYEDALREFTRDRLPMQWATAKMNLGNALRTLGERNSDTARLEEAVCTYEDALLEGTRDRVPMEWARTKMNLGNALATLGERESDIARLKEAVRAYQDALLEQTRDRVPMDWAMTKMNLGIALKALGERDSDTARLEEAVRAYKDALLEFTRERVPLDWAAAKMNLGNALQRLGERDSDTARLEEAVRAYEDSLLERTRDRVPMQWAMVQGNLATLYGTMANVTGNLAHLDAAEAHLAAAREVFEVAGAGGYLDVCDNISASIAASRTALG
ncbi:MAG: tetratricopeptide repeat protein [Pseudomonadota bacterium]